jgi:hypothetical protein
MRSAVLSIIPDLTSGRCTLDFKGEVSFHPRPFVGVKIKSFSDHEINRRLSRQSGMSVVVHGHSEASKSYPFPSTRGAGSCQNNRRVTYICLHPPLLFMFASPPMVPFAVAAQFKAKDCDSSLAGNAGSNLAGALDVCLLWALCVVRLRSRRRADHSSGGVLPSVMYLSMTANP